MAETDIDIHVMKDDPEHEVRFTSGMTIYTEAFVENRWVGRYWTPDGRVRFPYQKWDQDAFRIVIDGEELKQWEFVSSEELPRTERGQRHYVVHLKSTARSIEVGVHTLLDGTPVLDRYLTITNGGNNSAGLTDLGVWAGQLWPDASVESFPDHARPDHVYTLGHGIGEGQMGEGQHVWKPLPYGKTVFSCEYGVCFKAPFFIARNEMQGQYFIGHFAWSTNYEIEFDCVPSDPAAVGEAGDKFGAVEQAAPPARAASLRFRVSPKARAALRVIAAGETVATPHMHLGHTEGTLDTAVQAMHEHVRRSVLATRDPAYVSPMEYHCPGDQGYTARAFGHEGGGDEKSALEHAAIAAALGYDIFLLSATWWDLAGDWYPSQKRFPNGLKPIRDTVHKKGMRFGLYVEIERVRSYTTPQDAPLARVAQEHPDWFGPAYVLDLANPEAAAWMEQELSRIFEEYGVDCCFLDFNPYGTAHWLETPRDGILESHWWRYYESFYTIFDRLQKKFPQMIVEQASAGGGRNDLGMVSRFHRTYLTDGLAMPHVIMNYAGQTLGLPPEILLIGSEEGANHMVGRGQLDTYLRIKFALSTPLTIHAWTPTRAEITPWSRKRFMRYRKLYKEFIAPLLLTCLVYHHAPVSATTNFNSSGWFAMEFASPDHTKGWSLVVRIGKVDNDTYLFRPRGLDRGRKYRVTFDSTGETARVSAWNLVRLGVPIRLESMMESELILFEAQ